MSNNNDADARDAAPVEDSPSTADTLPIQPRPPRVDGAPVGAPPVSAAPRPVSAEPAAEDDKRVSRGWLIGAIAAGGVLLLVLAFGGGVATGLGIGAITRGGFSAQQGPGQNGPGDGRGPQWGPGAGPGQGRDQQG